MITNKYALMTEANAVNIGIDTTNTIKKPDVVGKI